MSRTTDITIKLEEDLVRTDLVEEVTDSDLQIITEFYVTNGAGYHYRRPNNKIVNPISLKEFRLYLSNFNRSIYSFQEDCRRSEKAYLFRGLEY